MYSYTLCLPVCVSSVYIRTNLSVIFCVCLSTYVCNIVCVSMILSRFESTCVRVCLYLCVPISKSVFVCVLLSLYVSESVCVCWYIILFLEFLSSPVAFENVYSSDKYEIICILISIWATCVNEHKRINIIWQTVE